MPTAEEKEEAKRLKEEAKRLKVEQKAEAKRIKAEEKAAKKAEKDAKKVAATAAKKAAKEGKRQSLADSIKADDDAPVAAVATPAAVAEVSDSDTPAPPEAASPAPTSADQDQSAQAAVTPGADESTTSMPDEVPLATAIVESVETNGDLADGVAPTAADGGGDDEEDGEEETSVYPIATRQDPISPAEAVAGVPDDWKGAAAWLTAVGVLPELDSGRDDPTCLDLILFIKDGTALCQAVNALAPGTIQTFSESPEKNFQQLANVAAFLEGCAALGIPEVDLCTADDIHSAAAVGAVLDTLALLSQTAAAKEKGFSQFSTAECTNDTVYSNLEEMVQQMADSLGEDANIELYAQVAKCADRDDSGGLYGLTAAGGERRLSDSWGPSGVVYTTVYDEARRKPVLTDDASGDHLFSKVEQMMSQQQKAEGANGEDAFESADFDDVYTACLYQPPEEGDAILYDLGVDSSDHRGHALAELLDTERNYLKVLKRITEHYYSRIKETPELCSDQERLVLFANVFELAKVHSGFLELIEAEMSSTTGRMISDAFINSIDCFRLYGEFCCRMPAAIDMYEAIRARSDAGKDLFEQARLTSGTDFPFRVLLNVPMQRVLKYPLLLKEIRKGTPDTHADKAGLNEAMIQLQGLAKLVNETMRDYETISAFGQNLKGFAGIEALYEFHRHRPGVLKDDDVAYRAEESKEKMAKRHCFLLPGGIVLSQAKGTTYVFKDVVQLDVKCTVEDASPLPKTLQTGKFREGLRVRTSDGVAHIIVTKSAASKDQWIAAIANNLAALVDSATKPTPSVPEPKTVAATRKKPAAGSPRASLTKDPRPDSDDVYNVAKAASPVEPVHPFAKMPWYLGKASSSDAAKALKSKREGTYLIRDSKNRPGQYVIGVMFNEKVIHVVVKAEETETGDTRYSLGNSPESESFDDIQDLLVFHRKNPIGKECNTPLVLPFKEAN
eukprot:m.37519 g.37519  ORF g.37519 m.37519 type:complete len:958 (+) comp13110_c0_seq1:229-3102(+)